MISTPSVRRNPRAYMIYYSCKEEAFALLQDVSTKGPLAHACRPDVNVTARKDEAGTCFSVWWDKGIKENKDTIADAYK